MLAFWRAEHGNHTLKMEVDFLPYRSFFFCTLPDELDIKETIYDEPFSYYIAKGLRAIDVQLYYHIDCFHFEEVKKLLAQGANPNINIEDDNTSDAVHRIKDEISYLASCHIYPLYKEFEKDGYKQEFDITYMFGNLIGLVAHQQMYDLIK